jgi:hypothetical protein
MNIIDAIAGSQRAFVKNMSRPLVYVQNDGVTIATILAYVRGLRAEDLFASALQQDLVAVTDAAAFAIAFPARSTPQRFDRLRIEATSYAVEDWRAAPAFGNPVFFKLQLRGGQS